VTATAIRSHPTVERLTVSAYEVPTDEPESDGTLEWDSTTLVLVELEAGGARGLGFTYDDVAAATLIDSVLRPVVAESDALAPPATWSRMQEAVRNVGRPGIAATAISAVDIALWDLKAKLLGVPLAAALPRFHDSVPIYGSGGFTSYTNERLADQLGGWADEGIPRVKIKVGRDPGDDLGRVEAARRAIGDEVELMVDANGAYTPPEAVAWAHRFGELGVAYFEEPVSSDDIEGLAFVRAHAPPGMSVAAGEYGWDLFDFRRLLDAAAVDVLQADVTRCGGITNFLRVDGVCRSHNVHFSAHCAPAISTHACCAMETMIHLEYFHDHVRVEHLLFEGTPQPDGGRIAPTARTGLGIEPREEAREYLVHPGAA
jgi:L-alanine-DL-glutamate epimerase-like enolase superfamily enzyme